MLRYRSACFCPCHTSRGRMTHMVACCQPDRPELPKDGEVRDSTGRTAEEREAIHLRHEGGRGQYDPGDPS